MAKAKEKRNAQTEPVKDQNNEITEEELPAEDIQEGDQDIIRIQEELELARSENAAAADMMLRLAAEMDNYKKRVDKERQSLIKYGSQGILQELLPILDNFERAIESANKSKDFDSFLEGVGMIFKQMSAALERKGISTIDAIGETFDPNIHEAVMQVASDKYSENTVVEELQKGYVLHDRVIRPAMVAVSKGTGEE